MPTSLDLGIHMQTAWYYYIIDVNYCKCDTIHTVFGELDDSAEVGPEASDVTDYHSTDALLSSFALNDVAAAADATRLFHARTALATAASTRQTTKNAR
jgi:hypothetical protein